MEWVLNESNNKSLFEKIIYIPALAAALFIIIYCVCALVPNSSGYSTSVVISSSEFHTGRLRSIHHPSGTT
jgi:hypothetical protein